MLVAAVAVPVLLSVGCGDDKNATVGPPTVVITKQGYSPAELQIDAGDRVVFVNRAGPGPHLAQDESGGDIEVSPQPGPTRHDGSEVNRASERGFVTHVLFPEEAQTVVFPVARTYRFYCGFDPKMRGTIEVRGG